MTTLKKAAPGVYHNDNGLVRKTFVGVRGHASMRWIIEYSNGSSEGVPTLAVARERLA